MAGDAIRTETAVAIAQNPPRPTPRRTRAASRMGECTARTTRRLEITRSAANDRSTARRSNRRVAGAIKTLEKRATKDVVVTAWPAIPSVTPRSDAMGVRRLAGSISATMKPTTPRDSEKTARQLVLSGSVLLAILATSPVTMNSHGREQHDCTDRPALLALPWRFRRA